MTRLRRQARDLLSSAWATVGPPPGLRARMRWLFLIGSLANVLVMQLGLVFLSEAPLLQRQAASLGLLALAHVMIDGYRRRRFPRVAPVVEAVTVGLATASVADVHQVLEVFYVGMFFRILYRSTWEVAGLVASYASAYVVAAVIWPLVTGASLTTPPAELVSNLLGFAVVGVLKWGMAGASNASEAGAARERTLARAASAIMAAGGRQAIYTATLDAAQSLLRRTAVRRVSLEVEATPVQAAQVLVRDLAAHSAPTPQLVTEVLPLRLRDGRQLARLVIESDGPLTEDVTGNALTTLVAEVSMALESACLIEDLTQEVAERKHAETSLLLRDRALAAATTPIVVVDAQAVDRPIVYVNAAFERLTGYSADDLMGKTLQLLIGPDTDRAVVAELASAAVEGREVMREVATYRKDGSELWLEVAAAPVRNTDGVATHCVWVYTDCTQRREAERQARALAQAEKLRALGQLASGIAHDLNQALMLIASHGNIGLRALDEPTLDISEVRETLTVVTQAALDGGQTVRRLLVFAQAPSEGAMQAVDLTALAREVVQLTSPRWRDAAEADGHPIQLVLETVGHPALVGPRERLREALTNLVMNAADALPNGGTIRVNVYAEHERACIDVADDGIGMSPEVLVRVFEPFFSTKGDKGTGLGLATVFGLVEHLKGDIRIDSAPGEGATVRLKFPLVEALERPAAPNTTGASRAATIPRQLRILAVDDEPAITRSVMRLLRPAGHVVVTADSAEQALERLNTERYDVVVSDLGMGAGMNGWELASRVRQQWPDIRFVLATGWGATIDPTEAEQRGVHAVLAKPYQPADLERSLIAA